MNEETRNFASLSRNELRRLIEDLFSGRSLLPGYPDTPEDTLAALYRTLDRRSRTDLENAYMEVVLEAIKQHGPWNQRQTANIIAAINSIMLDSHRRSDVIDLLLVVVDAAEMTYSFGIALQALVALEYRLTADFWKSVYDGHGDSCLGPVFEGLALHSVETAVSVLRDVTWTQTAPNVGNADCSREDACNILGEVRVKANARHFTLSRKEIHCGGNATTK